MFAIEMLHREGQETREGAGERGDARYHGEADLQMTHVEGRKKEHKARKRPPKDGISINITVSTFISLIILFYLR